MEWIEAVRDFTNENLLIQLVIIISSVKLAGMLSDKLNQPTVFGKLLVGIIIGPSLLGLIRETETLKLLAELGVIVLMFLAGLETDVEEFKKAGYAATLTAIGGVVLPMAAGTVYSMATGYGGFIPLFIGTVLTATSVSISAQTLRELGRLRSKMGMTILGAAVIDDVLGIIALTLVLGLAGTVAGAGAHAGGGAMEVTMVLVKMAVFFLLSIYLGRLLIRPTLKRIRHFPVAQGLMSGALIIIFLFAFAAEKSGVANITGAYIAGIIMGTTKYRDEIVQKAEALGYPFLIPVFFVSIGLQAKVESIGGSLVFVVVLSLIAILTKIIGCGVGARVAHFGWKRSLVIGTGMVSRGEIALIIASIGLRGKIIDAPLYTALVIMVLVSTIITPPLLKAVIHWSDKKHKTTALADESGK